MKLIDTHCHLYLKEFASDLQGVIERAEAEGVSEFLLPAIDSTENQALIETENRYSDKCHAMMGLHPCSVKAEYEQELQLVEDWFEKRRFIAVGEIGLDYYWDLSFKFQQQDAFRRQMDLAQRHSVPIVIHSRDSLDDCIKLVREQEGGITGVFHCFSGTLDQARQIIELGFKMGIGGVITYKNAGLSEVIKEIDLEHLVLETDAPYLTPVPFRGKRNESSYLKYIVKKLAEVKGVEEERVAEVTTLNAERLFKLNS